MNTQCLDLDLHRLDLRFAGARAAEPRAVGPGVPALASWARMYCLPNSFTVCQSSLSSLAISRIGALRQRRPTSRVSLARTSSNAATPPQPQRSRGF
jgi:hypothetical protein